MTCEKCLNKDFCRTMSIDYWDDYIEAYTENNVEVKCSGFKDKSRFLDLSNPDVAEILLHGKRQIGMVLKETKGNFNLQPKNTVLFEKLNKLKRQYEMVKDLRLKSLLFVEEVKEK